MTRHKRIRKVAKDWWDAKENAATHPNVNHWPQLKARVTLTVLLILLAFLVYLVVALVAVLVVILGLPIAIWRQFDRIHSLWSDKRRYKPPEVVR